MVEKDYMLEATWSVRTGASTPAETEHCEKANQGTVVQEESQVSIEARLRRKFDRRVLPLAILLYFSAFIDRSNMGNARILGLEDDINLGGNRFNIILTAFFVTYIIFDIPCNMVCKKLGPRIWLPFLCASFGLVTMCIAFVESFGGLIVVRTLLGIFESGLLPGVMLTLGRYYRRHEIATRIGWLSAVTSLSGAFGGLLATGFSRIPKRGILERWRWVFLLEGILTILVAILAFFTLPNSPAEAAFLTEEEKIVGTERLVSEQKTVGDDPIDFRAIKMALLQPPAQLIALGLISSLCCMNSVALFMPTLLHSMGFTSVRSQLMTVPPYVWGAIVCICTATLSDRIKNRGYIMICLAACIISGFAILATVKSIGARYFAIFLATTGGFCGSPLLLSWAVDNAAGAAIKAVVSAYVISIGSFGALTSTWTYRPSDAPFYAPGHFMNLGFGVLMFVAVSSLSFYAKWENNQRAKGNRNGRLLTPNMNEVSRLGHLHPEFRYTP